MDIRTLNCIGEARQLARLRDVQSHRSNSRVFDDAAGRPQQYLRRTNQEVGLIRPDYRATLRRTWDAKSDATDTDGGVESWMSDPEQDDRFANAGK